ncbi:MAG: hypothetical protein AAF357_15840 [Verrucomicrobiota bacterium]
MKRNPKVKATDVISVVEKYTRRKPASGFILRVKDAAKEVAGVSTSKKSTRDSLGQLHALCSALCEQGHFASVWTMTLAEARTHMEEVATHYNERAGQEPTAARQTAR